MKVYGFDSTSVARGEILAAEINRIDLDFGLDVLARELNWERADTAFKSIHQALLKRMQEEGVDPDLLATARQIKANYVSVTEDLTG